MPTWNLSAYGRGQTHTTTTTNAAVAAVVDKLDGKITHPTKQLDCTVVCVLSWLSRQ